jgi:hypothetical protein
MGRREMYAGFVRNPEGKDHLKDQGIEGIKRDLREIGWGCVEWIHLA